MPQPVVLCGLGRVGWRVLEYLRTAGLPVVVVDTHASADDPRLEGVRVVAGDCRERTVLEQAGLARARGVLILTSDDLVNISAALMVRSMHADVRIVVRMFNQNLIQRLGKAVANAYALSVSALTAPLIALTALTGESLGAFSLESGRRQIAALRLQEGAPLVGQPIASIARRYAVIPLAHLAQSGEERLLGEVAPDAVLEAGDQLVVCGSPRDLAPLLAQVTDELLPHLRWAGWVRRQGRMLWRTLREIDLPVKIASGVLIGVLVLGTLIYYFGVYPEGQKKTLPRAFFRTVSIISTGSDLHEDELSEDWQRVFVSLLRISGAALVAAFTAIVTNYLLRARLGGALEVRRIPDGGHVVVCGLGNVGFRVVEELLRAGERVVVIELSRDSRFLVTARRLGVPVIVGDATVLEVLRQAHAGQARAVVAATSNELANLEIALLARELNPRQRMVVRLSDARLAQTLRDAANVRFALSLPELAAPAFAAALYGDRVQSIFLVGQKRLAVVEIGVESDDPHLHGQTVRALATDHRLLPLKLTRAGRADPPDLMDHRLEFGDQLTVIAALPDLERLLRRATRLDQVSAGDPPTH
jgi:Trk K+ transport system NAD-binding subunit